MKKNGGTFGCGKVATDRSCVSSSVVFRIGEAILPHLVSFMAYTVPAGDYPHYCSVGEVAAMKRTLARTITDTSFVPFFTSIEIRDFDLSGEVPIIHVGFLYTRTSTFQM